MGAWGSGVGICAMGLEQVCHLHFPPLADRGYLHLVPTPTPIPTFPHSPSLHMVWLFPGVKIKRNFPGDTGRQYEFNNEEPPSSPLKGQARSSSRRFLIPFIIFTPSRRDEIKVFARLFPPRLLVDPSKRGCCGPVRLVLFRLQSPTRDFFWF